MIKHDIDDIYLRVEIKPYMLELPAKAGPTENLEENSETSISDGDDESRLLNTIWSVVYLEKVDRVILLVIY